MKRSRLNFAGYNLTMNDRIGQVWTDDDGPQQIFLIIESEDNVHTTINLLSGVQEFKISENGTSSKLENWRGTKRLI
jgi:hypothetical protein